MTKTVIARKLNKDCALKCTGCKQIGLEFRLILKVKGVSISIFSSLARNRYTTLVSSWKNHLYVFENKKKSSKFLIPEQDLQFLINQNEMRS